MMGGWFDEFFENYTGRNRFFTTSSYNPSAGEFYIYSFLGALSSVVAAASLIYYFTSQSMVISMLIAVLALGFGIAGLILSFKNLPYAIRCKSVYRVGTVFVGILFSLVGIIVCVILGVIIVKVWTSVGFTF